MAPTGGAIDISLSLRMTISRPLRAPALFMASYAMPADMAPSPITAMTLCFFPSRSRATAMPSAAEIDVEECAAPNGSYSLSARLVNPDKPPPWRSVRMRSRRPVRILCGYAWWPTSQISLSSGVSKIYCSATVSSITPSPAPRWPPVLATASMVSTRNSSASCLSCSADRFLRSRGRWMRSSRGVLEASDISNSEQSNLQAFPAGPVHQACRWHWLTQFHHEGQLIDVKRLAAGGLPIGIERDFFDARLRLAQ